MEVWDPELMRLIHLPTNRVEIEIIRVSKGLWQA
jgi:hypothetical protein